MSSGEIDPKQGTSLIRRGRTWRDLTAFEEALGGRQTLVQKLGLMELTPKQAKLLGLMTDPARRGDSLASLCRDAGIQPHQILQIVRESAFTTAMAQAQIVLAEHLPGVVEEVASQALLHTERCDCTFGANGLVLEATEGCTKCGGKGILVMRGSIEHQKLVMEATQLLKKGGGVNVQVQQNNVVGAGTGGFFDKLMKATDGAMYGVEAPRGGVVEGVVVDAEAVDGPGNS